MSAKTCQVHERVMPLQDTAHFPTTLEFDVNRFVDVLAQVGYDVSPALTAMRHQGANPRGRGSAAMDLVRAHGKMQAGYGDGIRQGASTSGSMEEASRSSLFVHQGRGPP